MQRMSMSDEQFAQWVEALKPCRHCTRKFRGPVCPHCERPLLDHKPRSRRS